MFTAEAERRFQPCKVQRMLVSAAAQAVAHVGQGEGRHEERLNSPQCKIVLGTETCCFSHPPGFGTQTETAYLKGAEVI